MLSLSGRRFRYTSRLRHLSELAGGDPLLLHRLFSTFATFAAAAVHNTL